MQVDREFSASIIIPTKNRAELLKRFLPMLAEQSAPDPYEIIVVNNGSTDSTATLVGGAASRWPHVRMIDEPRPGIVRVRNTGAGAAKSPILIFVDDDMSVGTDFVARHLRAHREIPGGCVLGQILSAHGRHPFERMLAYIYDGPRITLPYRQPEPSDFWPGNISMARDLYFRFGGFNEAFAKNGYGGDLEFGARLLASGVKMRLVPEAISYQHFTERFDERLKKMFRTGLEFAYIKENHPDVTVSAMDIAGGRLYLRGIELLCRVAARVIEPFDTGEGTPVKPLAFVYDLGLRAATRRGMLDYKSGRMLHTTKATDNRSGAYQ
jgi:GT2 family glycosyltransferase